MLLGNVAKPVMYCRQVVRERESEEPALASFLHLFSLLPTNSRHLHRTTTVCFRPFHLPHPHFQIHKTIHTSLRYLFFFLFNFQFYCQNPVRVRFSASQVQVGLFVFFFQQQVKSKGMSKISLFDMSYLTIVYGITVEYEVNQSRFLVFCFVLICFVFRMRE